MKKKIAYFLAIILVLFLTSCADNILQKPFGSDLMTDSVFSNKQKALGAVSQAYSNSLRSGITLNDWDGSRTYGLSSGTLSQISDEVNDVKYSWEDGWKISHNGMTADDGTGIPLSDDGFGFNYVAIRHNYLVIENIDKAVDMTSQEKAQVKAEMKTLIAYRYEEMFKRYGSVPIVTKSLTSVDDIKIPRPSLNDMLDFIITLCDEAAVDLPDSYPDNFKGRATKGVALAVKAEVLMFAARPLFNSASPYLDLGAHNNFICFGNNDPMRWNKAIEASEAVLTWAVNNGYHIINTGSPLDDYGQACSTPNNPEVLIAYNHVYPAGNNGDYYDPRGQSGGANGMSFNQLTKYTKADGTEQIWPGSTPVSYSDYATKILQMEPRYLESAMGAGINAWNNPNDNSWSASALTYASNWEGLGGSEACGRRVKFWWHAGNRNWFDYPIYRLAEFYLNLAEAYNEVGNSSKSIENLNVIRNRAGLPSVTDTDPTILRNKIQREWGVEFYEEGHRIFDVKHWKLADIGTNIIGGPRKNFIFKYTNGTFAYDASGYLTYSVNDVFTGYWSPRQFLEPFPVKEVNIGYLIQNPGY